MSVPAVLLRGCLVAAACLLAVAATLAQPTDLAPDEGGFAPQNPVTTLPLNGREVQVEMEDLRHPLMLIQTTRGDLVVELFPAEAPQTVANFIALAEGNSPRSASPYYDGLQIHRVVRNFVIQGGSPTNDSSGGPGYSLADEMSAASLGLDRMPLINAQGQPSELLGIASADDFRHKVLEPLYRNMGISSEETLARRIGEVDQRLRSMSMQDFLEMQGWSYTRALTRAPLRGVIAMANRGPNSSGSQFFITLADTPGLSGRATVFGKVRGGMEVVETIGRLPTDSAERPLEPVIILGVRRLNPAA